MPAFDRLIGLTGDDVLRACPCGPVSGVRAKTYQAAMSAYADRRYGAVAVWVLDLLVGQLGHERALPLRDAPFVSIGLIVALTEGPPPTVALVSGRYVSVFGCRHVYDSESGEWAASPPERWFETRVFNVRELVAACLERAEAR